MISPWNKKRPSGGLLFGRFGCLYSEFFPWNLKPRKKVLKKWCLHFPFCSCCARLASQGLGYWERNYAHPIKVNISGLVKRMVSNFFCSCSSISWTISAFETWLKMFESTCCSAWNYLEWTINGQPAIGNFFRKISRDVGAVWQLQPRCWQWSHVDQQCSETRRIKRLKSTQQWLIMSSYKYQVLAAISSHHLISRLSFGRLNALCIWEQPSGHERCVAIWLFPRRWLKETCGCGVIDLLIFAGMNISRTRVVSSPCEMIILLMQWLVDEFCLLMCLGMLCKYRTACIAFISLAFVNERSM